MVTIFCAPRRALSSRYMHQQCARDCCQKFALDYNSGNTLVLYQKDERAAMWRCAARQAHMEPTLSPSLAELKSRLASVAGVWYVMESPTALPAPAASAAAETSAAASGDVEPSPPPPAGSREVVALEWAANDDWKASYSWKEPIADRVPVPEADAQAMRAALVERWGFQRAPREAYRRHNARLMLARHFRLTMADENERMSEDDAAQLADLFFDSFSDSDARFYCNWLGTDSCELVRIPGEAKEHMFEFVMVGVHSDRLALVATWDDWA